MKNLKAIQVLYKIGQIFSEIVNVCSIVGACICIVGIIAMPYGYEAFKIGGVSIHSMLINEGYGDNTFYAFLSSWLVILVGEAILARFAKDYFSYELKVGEPFTFEGAKLMMRLGILSYSIPLGTLIISEVVQGIINSIVAEPNLELGYEIGSHFAFGTMFIVLSLFCKYGAELVESRKSSAGETDSIFQGDVSKRME